MRRPLAFWATHILVQKTLYHIVSNYYLDSRLKALQNHPVIKIYGSFTPLQLCFKILVIELEKRNEILEATCSGSYLNSYFNAAVVKQQWKGVSRDFVILLANFDDKFQDSDQPKCIMNETV